MEKILLLTILDLISISNTREAGCQKVLLKIKDRGLEEIFTSFIETNKLFSDDLKDWIRDEPYHKINSEMVKPVYREWLKVKSENTISIIQEYIEAEKITFQAYKATLKMDLPAYIVNLLNFEMEGIYINVLKVIEYVREKFGSGNFGFNLDEDSWNFKMVV